MSDRPSDFGKTWRLNHAKCPECGDKLDAASKAMGEGGGPTPGCLAICAHCYTVNQYVEGKQEGDLELAPFDTSTLDLDERKEIQRLRLYLANHSQ
jgi:hypothetical protein